MKRRAVRWRWGGGQREDDAATDGEVREEEGQEDAYGDVWCADVLGAGLRGGGGACGRAYALGDDTETGKRSTFASYV